VKRPFVFFGNLLKNSWWFCGINFLNYHRQSEEEAGSAGEQPASNKIDTYTVIRQPSKGCLLFITGMF
jgi:hypothetical protein